MRRRVPGWRWHCWWSKGRSPNLRRLKFVPARRQRYLSHNLGAIVVAMSDGETTAASVNASPLVLRALTTASRTVCLCLSATCGM